MQSIKKYQNVKLQNFIETLYEQNVSVDRFSKEIEAYFFYHSIRKTKVIQSLQSQMRAMKGKNYRLQSSRSKTGSLREYQEAQQKNYNVLY